MTGGTLRLALGKRCGRAKFHLGLNREGGSARVRGLAEARPCRTLGSKIR